MIQKIGSFIRIIICFAIILAAGFFLGMYEVLSILSPRTLEQLGPFAMWVGDFNWGYIQEGCVVLVALVFFILIWPHGPETEEEKRKKDEKDFARRYHAFQRGEQNRPS